MLSHLRQVGVEGFAPLHISVTAISHGIATPIFDLIFQRELHRRQSIC